MIKKMAACDSEWKPSPGTGPNELSLCAEDYLSNLYVIQTFLSCVAAVADSGCCCGFYLSSCAREIVIIHAKDHLNRS